MKKIVLLLLFCGIILSLPSAAQSAYLNHRSDYGYDNFIFTGIIPTDSAVYMKGVMVDTLGRWGSFFGKFDLEGNKIFITEIIKDSFYYDTWSPNLTQNKVGNFIVCGQSTTTVRSEIFLYEFDSQGQVLRKNLIPSPYGPERKSIGATSIYMDQDGNYIISGVISGQQISYKTCFVAKTDQNFNLLWIKQIGYEDRREGVAVAIPDTDHGIILGGMIYDKFNTKDNFIQKYVVKLDSTAEEEEWVWRYPAIVTPDYKGLPVNDLLLLPDGSLIGTGGKVKENALWWFTYTYPTLFKLSPTQELLWETPIGNGHYSPQGDRFDKIIPANEGGGYIAIGSLTDTMSVNPPQFDMIAKVSENGDSLWMRLLRFNTDTLNGSYTNGLYDIKPAPGGGYWLCGYAFQPEVDSSAYQKGWLIRIDDYGCMVPDCQLVGTNIVEDMEEHIKVYPNPASDYIAIYHAGYSFQKGVFHLTDINGRNIKTWRSPSEDITTVCYLDGLANGSYYVRYEEEGKVIVSKMVVVVR